MIGKSTIVIALSAIGCLIGGLGLAAAGMIPPMLGLALFALSGLLGLVALVAGGVAALRHHDYLPALIGMLGILPLVAVTAGIADAFRYPPINDISTDTVDPPTFSQAATLPENQGRNLAFPAENSTVISSFYSDVQPLLLPEPALPVAKHAIALATSKEFGWTITHELPDNGGFEAIAQTRLFRWKDDVILRIRPREGGGSIVDMRSKSREGKSDLGANARRIRRFLKALED